MKKLYAILAVSAAVVFGQFDTKAFTVDEIVGTYTATDMDFSEFWAVFTNGNENLKDNPQTWTDMSISIVEGNKIKITNFIKKGINDTKGVFDIEGDFDPATNTITFQPTGYEYQAHPTMSFLGKNRPMIAKYAEGEELEAIEYVEDLKPFTATFDDQKTLTVNPWTVYMRDKELVGISRVGGSPKYKVGETEVYGTRFTNNANSGIENITVDENAPVEYYNLQGIKVENPENGMFIRRQGSKAQKVIIR